VRPSWNETIFANTSDFTALSSFTAEASLLAGLNQQPIIPAAFFADMRAYGSALRVKARGVVGCTGTPTYTFQVRLGSTAGSSDLTGASVGVSAAITMQSGVSNKQWELELTLVCTTPGIASTNGVLSGAGFVSSFHGFASPFWYPLQPTTPDTATWTTGGFNFALQHYLNLSVTCSASSASNTIRAKQLVVETLG
jgi:hypothetical protein